MKKLLVILIIAFIIRLFHVSFTVIGWHSWRQSDTAAIARNFYENGYNILYPQIDWRGNTTGYVESEFHIYPFTVSLLYGIFGVHESIGRIVSIIFSLFTVLGIYLLVKKFLDEKIALWSSLFYSILPLNIYYGRAFMPESLMLMCSVYGIYFFTEWIDNDKWKNFILTFFFISLAVLVKLTSLYLGFIMLFLVFQKYGKKLFTNWKVLLLPVLILIPVIAWYYHAHNLYLYTGLSFSIWEFSGDKWANINILSDLDFYQGVFLRNIAERHLTYPGFVLFITGLFIKRKDEKEKIFDFWLISVLIYFLVVARGVNVHEYYQLPFTIPAVVFMGKTINKLIERFKKLKVLVFKKIIFALIVLLLLLIPALSVHRVINFYKSENSDNPIFDCANEIQLSIGKNDLIITVCNGNPVYLYIFKKKGWVLTPDNLKSEIVLDLYRKGAKCISVPMSFIDTPERQKNFENFKQNFPNFKIIKDYTIFYFNGK